MTIPIYKNGTGYVAGVIKCGVDIEVTDLGDGVVLLGDLSETSQWASRSRSVSVSGSRSVSKSMSRSVSKSRSNSRSAAPFSQSRSASTAPFSRSRSASNAPLSQSRSASQVLSQSRSVSRAPASQSRSVSRVLSQSRSASNAPFSRSKSSSRSQSASLSRSASTSLSRSRSQSVSGSRSRSTSRSAIPTCYNSISDDFNRADETPLADYGITSSNCSVNLSGNQVVITAASDATMEAYVEPLQPTCSNDHYVQAKWVDVNEAYSTGRYHRQYVRGNAYIGQVYANSSGGYPNGKGSYELIRPGPWTSLASLHNQNEDPTGQTFKTSMVGTTLTLYRNGVVKLSATDSTVETGAAVKVFCGSGGAKAGSTMAFDDFVSGVVA